MTEAKAGIQIQARWPRDAVAGAAVANQILIIEGPGLGSGSAEGGVYLLLGHLAPPILPDEASMQAFLASGGFLDVAPRGAFYVTTERLREFHSAIGRHLAKSGQGEGES